MTENIKTPVSNEKPNFDQHVDDVLELQQSSESARRLVSEPLPSTEVEDNPNKNFRLTKLGKAAVGTAAIAALTAAGFIGANEINKINNGPSIVVEGSTDYVAGPGGSVFDAATHVEGNRDIDLRDLDKYISEDPANIEILKRGLKPGDILKIPVSVRPK